MTEPELNQAIKDPITNLCRGAFLIIKKFYPQRHVMVIHIKDDHISIGHDINGIYHPDYYIPSKTDNLIAYDPLSILYPTINEQFKNLIDTNKDSIDECLVEIHKIRPKLKTFNIFYNGGDRSINICESKIGRKPIYKCQIFKQFIDKTLF
jgi:hypothetical protein